MTESIKDYFDKSYRYISFILINILIGFAVMITISPTYKTIASEILEKTSVPISILILYLVGGMITTTIFNSYTYLRKRYVSYNHLRKTRIKPYDAIEESQKEKEDEG